MASEKPRSLRRKAPQRLEARTPNRAATQNDPHQHPARQLFEVSMRYNRCAHTFLAAITLAATVTFWLNQ